MLPMTTRSVSSSVVTLASAAPPPGVVMVASATTTTAAAAATTSAVGGDWRSTRLSAGQQKRRRISTTSSSRGSSSSDANRGVASSNFKEDDDDEEHRAVLDTAKKYRRSELLQDDDATAAVPVEATGATTTITRPSASTNGMLRPRGGSPSNKWELTPVSLLLRTLGYMDNDTLMLMCLVCKQIKELIWTGQGMQNKLVRIFKLSSSKNNDLGDDFGYGRPRVRRFISNMNQYFENISKTRILQGFQHWKVEDVEEFVNDSYEYINPDELERLTQNIRMTGIVSLDLSLSLPFAGGFGTLQRAISCMVPNLHELDLSHTNMRSSILKPFAVRCPRLEIIRWNFNNDAYGIDAIGYEWNSLNFLKELYFDNCYFQFSHEMLIYGEEGTDDDGDGDGDGDFDFVNDNRVTEMEAMSDSNNYPNIFLFHKLNNNPLERISLRNARYTDFDLNEGTVPQQILMKFVRKAPSTLVWFRSDLAAANIRVLQSERPGIEFLN